MRRRLFVVPLLAVLAGTVLLVLAATVRTSPPRSLAIAVGRSTAYPDARFWPVSVALGPAPSAVDVVLSVRLDEGETYRRHLMVEVCRTDTCDGAPVVWASRTGPTGTFAIGRVGTVEPGDVLHLGLRLTGGSAQPARLAVNASPCSAPRSDDLWRTKRTALPPRSNTLAGVENCSSRPAPYLPFALELLGVGAAVTLSSRRFGP